MVFSQKSWLCSEISANKGSGGGAFGGAGDEGSQSATERTGLRLGALPWGHGAAGSGGPAFWQGLRRKGKKGQGVLIKRKEKSEIE